MSNDTLFDKSSMFWVSPTSSITDKEVARLNRILHAVRDMPTEQVVEKFLAQTMSGDLDMGGFDINNAGSVTPETDNSPSLGSASKYWKEIFAYQVYAKTFVKITEAAAAAADEAGIGQFWVKNDTPNVPMFTDDAGTDVQLGAGGNYPKRGLMEHRFSNITVGGGSMTHTHDTNSEYGFYDFISTHADADAFTNSCYLEAGTYEFKVLAWTFSNRGKVDFYLDAEGSPFGTIDFNSGGVVNDIKTISGVTVTGDGYHKLTGITNGQTGSDYYIVITRMWFYRTSD